MNSKVQFLFEMNKLLVRPTPEQSDFENKNYDVLKAFEDAVYTGFDKTRQEMKGKPMLSVNFNWFPNAMNGNVLSDFGIQYPELVKPTGRKNHCIMLAGGYESYIKKANRKLMPSYNHSNTTEAMIEQLALPEQEPLPLIFLLYKLSKTNDDIKGVFAVCIKGKDRLWVTDISSLEPPMTGDRFATPTAPTPAPGILVVPKRKKKAQ